MSKSTRWFLVILGVLALLAIGAILILVSMVGKIHDDRTETVTSGSGDKIAVIDLKGVITSSDDFIRQIKKYREQRGIKAILLHIDSPGGSVVPSQEMYEEVKKTKEEGKPVVVSMGSLAASGGYYVACPATRIVANKGTLTGSIGVISEFLQLYEGLAKLGIEIKTIKAGKLKDAGSYARPMNEDDVKYFQSVMDEVHEQFIQAVEQGRGMRHADVVALADGRVFTGEQAARLGLVDTIGTYEDAIRITAALAGIKGEPAIVSEHKRQSFFQSVFGDAEGAIKDLKQEVLDRPIMSYRFAQP